jgi:hypothetical protein
MSEIQHFYHNNLRNMKPKGDNISQFLELIRNNIPIFSKTSPIISESILKLGFII